MTEATKTPQVLPAAPAKKTQSLATAISGRMAAFADVQTRYLTAEKLVKLAHLAISRNHDLADCSTVSVLECLMTCARLGLEPGEPGGVWLVPFKRVCTAIIDYRGMLDVARRSGDLIAGVHTAIRYKNDKWKFAISTTGPILVNLEHEPADGDRGPIMGAYFVAKLRTGECQAAYLDREAIDRFRGRSKADQFGSFSPWKTDYEAMAMKTAIRRGVNLLPKTPDLQILREELKREETGDRDIIGDLPEGSNDAIDRMLADIAQGDQAMADQILAGFTELGYGPARRLQLLTKNVDDPKGLLTWLQTELGRKEPKTLTEGAPVERIEPAKGPARETVAEPVPAKNKGGRPKKKDTKAAKRETKEPASESKAADPESNPPKPETAKPKPTLPAGASF